MAKSVNGQGLDMIISKTIKKQLTSAQAILLGFAAVILMGALLLCLPAASSSGVRTSFFDSLFTATSAVCVTGLVVVDTGTYWSFFGQVIILLLIQIGGLGVVTVTAVFSVWAGRKIGLFQRSTIQEASAAPSLQGVVRLALFILKFTSIVELTGAALMLPVFAEEFGWRKGVWMSVFHSVSAFCNAGIDLMGIREPFASLTYYAGDPAINLSVMGLIVIGGLGFLTWDDVRTHGIHLYRYRMQSKVIITTTCILILLSAVYFFAVEYSNMPIKERILASLFHAITPRTAGFNTMDLTALRETSQLIMIFLMLIGGSPGSTAGGMKTTTITVLLANTAAVFQKRDSAQLFGRRLSHETVASASALALQYLLICAGGAAAISLWEELPLMTCLFETASALGTVGLTLGITPGLGTASKAVLMLLMFIGRVGGLTWIYASLKGMRQPGRLPVEKITVG